MSAAATLTCRADVIFSEDFSDGDGGFEVTSDGDPTGPWEFNSGQGTWSVDGDGGLGTPTWNALTTPGIVVPAEIALQITIVHRYSIEPQWDGTALAVSVNSSDEDDFEVLEGTTFIQNGYTFQGLLGNHILGEQQGGNGEGFNGNSPGYDDEEFITSVAQIPAIDPGDTLRVQFIGGWDEGAVGTFPNWEVDSIVVETLTDMDEDGMPDSYEDRNGLDKTVNDADGDLDEDTVSNIDEFANGTDPQSKDSDGDDLEDNVETNTGVWVSATDTGTNPLSDDSDEDSLKDAVETNTGTFVSAADTGTDPNREDSDGDNFADALEINNGSDPTDAESLPAVPTFEVLDDLIGGDLTDPEDDGDETAGEEDPSWNWASIESNDEPGFQGGEFAFNVFDNNKDAGGNDKWCCTGASEDAPLQLTVEFELPISLTHFTITSANDVPDRDPRNWKILGSNDGESFSSIFEREDELSLWQELGDEFDPPRFTTIKVTLPTAAPLFKYIRYEVTGTGNANHQIGELEYFGTIDSSDTDADGLPDAWEEVFGLDVGTNDAELDGDNDGLTNKQEFDLGTTPNKDDTDEDGLKDGVETGTGTYVDATNTGTDPLVADTDDDGLEDGVETATGTFVSATDTGTNPVLKDSDGSGTSDGQEVKAGTDPNDASSEPVVELLAAWDFEDSGDDTEAVDLVSGIVAVNNGAEYVDDPDRGSVIDFAASGFLQVEEASFLNAASAADQVSFVFWQLNGGTPNSSTFWAASPSTGNNQRGAQAHVPWGNGSIFFDTAGCCGADTRLTFNPDAELEGGFDFADEQWHHYAFVKDGENKSVWIDGVLAFETVNTGTLPDDFAELWIGCEVGGINIADAKIDDFAVYAGALTATHINEVKDNGFGGGGVPFQIVDVMRVSATNAIVTWESKQGRSYSIDHSSDLEDWIEGIDGLEADGDRTSFEDDTLTAETVERYYRIREE